MLPYLLEGLDCSGKKAVGKSVMRLLKVLGYQVETVVGPLVKGPLGSIDSLFANIVTAVPRNSVVGVMRRSIYVIGPIVDRAFFRPQQDKLTLKISSHYRAWARASVDNDTAMTQAFARTARLQMNFSGATLLSTQFATRLNRHRADVAAGSHKKDERLRFFGPDEKKFILWHKELDRLLSSAVPALLRLDTDALDPDALAAKVVEHIVTLE